MKNKLFSFLMLAMLLTSCGTLNKGGTSQSGDMTTTTVTDKTSDPSATVISALGNWQTMQTSGNIALKGSSNFSSAVQVRMVRDEAIFISLRPMLGIEVGRLVITADSVFAVDKVHRRFVAEKLSVLTAGIPVTVKDVQDMFLGRPFVLGQGTLCDNLKSRFETVKNGNTIVMRAQENYKGYGYSFSFDKADHISSLDIVPTGDSMAAYQIKYADVKSTEAGNIAHALNVNAEAQRKKMSFSLNYKNIEWNGKVKIDKSIPGGYSRMGTGDLFLLFSN